MPRFVKRDSPVIKTALLRVKNRDKKDDVKERAKSTTSSWRSRLIKPFAKVVPFFLRWQHKQPLQTATHLEQRQVKLIYKRSDVLAKVNSVVKSMADPEKTVRQINTCDAEHFAERKLCLEKGIEAIQNIKNELNPIEQQTEKATKKNKGMRYLDEKAVHKICSNELYNYYVGVLKKCKNLSVVMQIESTIPEYRQKDMLDAKQIVKLNKLISDLKRRIPFIWLRDKHGKYKTHETKKIQTIKNKILYKKEFRDIKNKVRNEKIICQKNFQNAEIKVLRGPANSIKIANAVNKYFSEMVNDEKFKSFQNGICAIVALKNRPEVGKEIIYHTEIKKQHKSVIYERDKIEKINNKVVLKFCQDVVSDVTESEAIDYLFDDINDLKKRSVINNKIAERVKEMLTLRKREIDVYFSYGSRSNVEKHWNNLDEKTKNKMKSQLRYVCFSYKKSAESIFSKTRSSAKASYEKTIKNIIIKYIGQDMYDLATSQEIDEADEWIINKKREAKRKFKWAVNMLNYASNESYLESSKYRKARAFFIQNELKRNYGTQFTFSTETCKSAFRAVASKPEKIFKQGFMPALLSRMSYQKGLLNEPYVNDAAVCEEKVGWTGGVVSLSDNFLHSAGGVYTATTGQSSQSRWIYLVLPYESADVSQHLHWEADNYALDAREVMTTAITPERVIAARSILSDGSLSQIHWNSACPKGLNFSNNADFVHFLNATHIKEVEEREPDRVFNQVLGKKEQNQSLPEEERATNRADVSEGIKKNVKILPSEVAEQIGFVKILPEDTSEKEMEMVYNQGRLNRRQVVDYNRFKVREKKECETISQRQKVNPSSINFSLPEYKLNTWHKKLADDLEHQKKRYSERLSGKKV